MLIRSRGVVIKTLQELLQLHTEAVRAIREEINKAIKGTLLYISLIYLIGVIMCLLGLIPFLLMILIIKVLFPTFGIMIYWKISLNIRTILQAICKFIFQKSKFFQLSWFLCQWVYLNKEWIGHMLYICPVTYDDFHSDLNNICSKIKYLIH